MKKKNFVLKIVVAIVIMIILIMGFDKFVNKQTENQIASLNDVQNGNENLGDLKQNSSVTENVLDNTIENNAEINTENNDNNTIDGASSSLADEGYRLNHLSNTEPSFGKLDVPVYKKDEKNLKIPLLIYHAFVTPIPEGDTYNLFSCEENFGENVKTLLDNGYTFLTLEDIYKYEQGYIGLPEKNITITMDDGWYGCYTDAFNILKKYNVPATIFIVEDLVGTDNYFSWDEAREMYNTGLVKIHVHGKRHVEATGYSKEALIEAYNSTHEKIEKELGDKLTKIMAYPARKKFRKYNRMAKRGRI